MKKHPQFISAKSLLRGAVYAALSTLLIMTAGCSDSGENSGSTGLTEIDLSSDVTALDEVDRLRHFRETKADLARKNLGLTGKGVRITIMGEIADGAHPDLKQRVMQQFNTFSQKGSVLPGAGNQAYRQDLYGVNSGHGTHIAGTIAAECDGVGIQGIACDALLDVYDIGTYGNEAMPQNGWGDTHDLGLILTAFTSALNDVRVRGLSRITTGSFNLEAPAIPYKTGGPLEGLSATQIVNYIEANTDDLDDLLSQNIAEPVNATDRDLLRRVTVRHDDLSIPLSTLLPKSTEWQALETAVADYQSQDGVYLVTESNYTFEHRSSVLNAMPTLSDKVAADLWLSVVMAQPEGIDAALANPDTTMDDITALMQGKYITPLNSCGDLASEYCILTPSYGVLSTMTRRFAEPDSALYLIEQRAHQIYSGHSMGAPMVAAALALMEEHNVAQSKGYSMKDLVKILKDNAHRSFPGYDAGVHGRGLLDVYAALQAM